MSAISARMLPDGAVRITEDRKPHEEGWAARIVTTVPKAGLPITVDIYDHDDFEDAVPTPSVANTIVECNSGKFYNIPRDALKQVREENWNDPEAWRKWVVYQDRRADFREGYVLGLLEMATNAAEELGASL